MATVLMVCSAGHHWGALIANRETFDAHMATRSKEVLCPRCGEICVGCRDFYSLERWPFAAGAAAMNGVFCHHPSTIQGRNDRCPDCHAKPGDSRSSQPIDDLTLGIWADLVMKRWGDTSAVRITED